MAPGLAAGRLSGEYPKEHATMDERQGGQPHVANHGWRVTFAGLGINLALGILYSWSMIKKGIPKDWGWSDFEKTLPYSTAVLVFSLMMVPAGRLQDKVGPRLVATIGGLLVGIGMVLTSLAATDGLAEIANWLRLCLAPGLHDTVVFYFIGFGLLAGTGIGFGYASATPPAVKWFPAARTGLIAGLVVSGFGLAPVYAAPLTEWLIAAYGLQNAIMILGIAFLVVVVGLSQLLTPPPKGYVPAFAGPNKAAGTAAKKEDFRPTEMLATFQFYLFWFMYACGAGAGLMVIANLATAIAKQADITTGFILVASCAVGNGSGRILAGVLSDKFGRQRTLCGFFLLQAAFLVLLSFAGPDNLLGSLVAMSLIVAVIGGNYGANLALFPSMTKDYYGLKNFGVNYGLVFTAWGCGGFMLAQVASAIYDKVGTFEYNYYGAAVLLVIAAAATLLIKPPHVAHHAGQ
jgi:MFS transporter, OFA family, oxalate/formate antiporter